jgi:hypothetical protein
LSATSSRKPLARRRYRIAGDDGERHGQDEADEAEEKAPQRRDDEHEQRVNNTPRVLRRGRIVLRWNCYHPVSLNLNSRAVTVLLSSRMRVADDRLPIVIHTG